LCLVDWLDALLDVFKDLDVGIPALDHVHELLKGADVRLAREVKGLTKVPKVEERISFRVGSYCRCFTAHVEDRSDARVFHRPSRRVRLHTGAWVLHLDQDLHLNCGHVHWRLRIRDALQLLEAEIHEIDREFMMLVLDLVQLFLTAFFLWQDCILV
jgi:hypothetical protein